MRFPAAAELAAGCHGKKEAENSGVKPRRAFSESACLRNWRCEPPDLRGPPGCPGSSGERVPRGPVQRDASRRFEENFVFTQKPPRFPFSASSSENLATDLGWRQPRSVRRTAPLRLTSSTIDGQATELRVRAGGSGRLVAQKFKPGRHLRPVTIMADGLFGPRGLFGVKSAVDEFFGQARGPPSPTATGRAVSRPEMFPSLDRRSAARRDAISLKKPRSSNAQAICGRSPSRFHFWPSVRAVARPPPKTRRTVTITNKSEALLA